MSAVEGLRSALGVVQLVAARRSQSSAVQAFVRELNDALLDELRRSQASEQLDEIYGRDS